jgi:hypothetical protein
VTPFSYRGHGNQIPVTSCVLPRSSAKHKTTSFSIITFPNIRAGRMIRKFELYQADKPWLCLSLMLETGGGRELGGHTGLTGGEPARFGFFLPLFVERDDVFRGAECIRCVPAFVKRQEAR